MSSKNTELHLRCHLWPSQRTSLLLNVMRSGSPALMNNLCVSRLNGISPPRQRCSWDGFLKGLNKKWCLSPVGVESFLLHFADTNKSQVRIPLIRHYLSTGCLIIFHRKVAPDPEKVWQEDRLNAALIPTDLNEKCACIPLTFITVDEGAVRAVTTQTTVPDFIFNFYFQADIDYLAFQRLGQKQTFGGLSWRKKVYTSVWHSEPCLSRVELVWSSYPCYLCTARPQRPQAERCVTHMGRHQRAAYRQV